MSELLIIGGSDAGISAGLRARELDHSAQVTLVVADDFPNYSICGLPFYLSGEVADWRNLAHRTREELEGAGLNLLLRHVAQKIDPLGHTVSVLDPAGKQLILGYDKLVIGTGALPVRPRLAGLDLPGVFQLHTIDDSFKVESYLSSSQPRSAVVIGAGYIGVEMADALTRRGLRVSLLGRSAAPLPTVDVELGRLIEAELRRCGVEVVDGIDVQAIEPGQDDGLVVLGADGSRRSAEMVLVAVGVRPGSDLASAAGIPTGTHGAIQVNRHMETGVPGIYAAGDCAETWHRLLERYVYLPLGTTSHKQGRVAGENAVGGAREFAGSLGTQVVKVFDLAAARTGLNDQDALDAGFAPSTVQTTVWDHKQYYPGAREIVVRITGDRHTGRLLGAQMMGHWQAEVAKRIDIFAAALFNEMRVDDLNEIDLSYTPPLSSPWDPVQVAAQTWSAQVNAASEQQSRKIRRDDPTTVDGGT